MDLSDAALRALVREEAWKLLQQTGYFDLWSRWLAHLDAHEARVACLTTCPGAMPMTHPSVSAGHSEGVTTMSVELLAANLARLGFIIKNTGPATLYVAYGVTAALLAYTVDIEPDGIHVDSTGWVGAVSGITASGTATALITELG
jgi:hypothetical protein